MVQDKRGPSPEPTPEDLAGIEALYADLDRHLPAIAPKNMDEPELTPVAESILDDVHTLLSSPYTEPLASKVLTNSLQTIARLILGPDDTRTIEKGN